MARTYICLRSGKKWTIPELISLQREYELIGLSVQKIAQLHHRTIFAILARIESEGFINTDNNNDGSNANASVTAKNRIIETRISVQAKTNSKPNRKPLRAKKNTT